MVSQKVIELRKISVHSTFLTVIEGSNRHKRRVEAARAHNYSELASLKARGWHTRLRGTRKAQRVTRKRNRKA